MKRTVGGSISGPRGQRRNIGVEPTAQRVPDRFSRVSGSNASPGIGQPPSTGARCSAGGAFRRKGVAHKPGQIGTFARGNLLAMKDTRIGKMIQQYGSLALYIYFSIFAVTLLGFATALEMGVTVDGATEQAGLWGSAWLATKLTQPLRIVLTLFLTPLVASGLRRLGLRADPSSVASPTSDKV